MPNLEPLETIDSATRADPESEGRQMSQAEMVEFATTAVVSADKEWKHVAH